MYPTIHQCPFLHKICEKYFPDPCYFDIAVYLIGILQFFIVADVMKAIIDIF
jgi:hypothetical protein